LFVLFEINSYTYAHSMMQAKRNEENSQIEIDEKSMLKVVEKKNVCSIIKKNT